MYILTKTKTVAIAAITAIAILIPISAYSLGMGDIKLQSEFNQNLKAEIGLIASPGEDISNLSIGLAPAEKFDEAGIPWNSFLNKIKFKPVKKRNGTTVIELTSNEGFKEPVLSFVLEVRCSKSNVLYREFTVLLDPHQVK